MSFCRWSRLKPSLDQILHLCLAGRPRWENIVAPFWTGGYIRYIQQISSLIASQELHIFQQLFNNCSFEEFKDPLLSQQKSMLDYSYLDKKSNPLVLLISCFYLFLMCLVRFLFLSASKSESTGPLQTSSGSRLGEVSEGTVDGCGCCAFLCKDSREPGDNLQKVTENLNCQLRWKRMKEQKSMNKLKDGLVMTRHD